MFVIISLHLPNLRYPLDPKLAFASHYHWSNRSTSMSSTFFNFILVLSTTPLPLLG